MQWVQGAMRVGSCKMLPTVQEKGREDPTPYALTRALPSTHMKGIFSWREGAQMPSGEAGQLEGE